MLKRGKVGGRDVKGGRHLGQGHTLPPPQLPEPDAKRCHNRRLTNAFSFEQDIEGPGPAVPLARIFKGQHFIAVGRFVQPAWHRVPQDAAAFLTDTLSRDDDDATPSRRVLDDKERAERAMGLGLRHPMQIKPRFDR